MLELLHAAKRLVQTKGISHVVKKGAPALVFFVKTGYFPTVERENPEFPSVNFENHLRVYQFMSQFATGKDALDVGCGTGYGSHLLAATAASVVGIDLSRQALRFARSRYRRPNLKYLRMDAQQLKFPDATFDLIVSTENFEHLPDQPGHLHELARVLKPGGLCFIASPNPEMFVGCNNPYHTKENSFVEMQSLLKSVFSKFCIVENSLEPESESGRTTRKERFQRNKRGLLADNELRVFGETVDTTYLSNTHSFFCFARV